MKILRSKMFYYFKYFLQNPEDHCLTLLNLVFQLILRTIKKKIVGFFKT